MLLLRATEIAYIQKKTGVNALRKISWDSVTKYEFKTEALEDYYQG